MRADKPVVVCCDMARFIAFVMQERNIEDCELKIGADVGHGSFKSVINFLEKRKRKADDPNPVYLF